MPPKAKKKARGARTPAAIADVEAPLVGHVDDPDDPPAGKRRATRGHSKLEPAERYRVVCPSGSVVRAGAEMDSKAKPPNLTLGAEVATLNRRTIAGGRVRIQFSGGWTSESAGDGSPLLERLEPPRDGRRRLEFKKGDSISVTRAPEDSDWWEGFVDGSGAVPGVFHKGDSVAVAGGSAGGGDNCGKGTAIAVVLYIGASLLQEQRMKDLCPKGGVNCTEAMHVLGLAAQLPALFVLSCCDSGAESGMVSALIIGLLAALAHALEVKNDLRVPPRAGPDDPACFLPPHSTPSTLVPPVQCLNSGAFIPIPDPWALGHLLRRWSASQGKPGSRWSAAAGQRRSGSRCSWPAAASQRRRAPQPAPAAECSPSWSAAAASACMSGWPTPILPLLTRHHRQLQGPLRLQDRHRDQRQRQSRSRSHRCGSKN